MPTVTRPGRAGPDVRARAWGWVAHLAAGGTTRWSAWTADAGPGAGRLPGAQQLELLRRLNLAGRPAPSLVRRVLAADAVGRGRHDLELVGAAEPAPYGPAPVDPEHLPEEDLLRVAVGLLARDLLDSSVVSPGSPGGGGQTNRGVRRVRRRYRLVGDPLLADPLRAALTADGRPPGGTGAAVHVLGTDLATMLGDAWVTGAFAEGGPAWPDFLADWRARGGLPRRVDLVAAADRWRAAPGTGALDVVLDLAALPRLVGLRSGRVLPAPPRFSAASADLARRTAAALGLLAAPADRDRLLATRLRPRLERLPGAGPEVPDEHREWIRERAVRMRHRLARAGHRVVGDPDGLLPRWPDQPATEAPTPLDVAVTLLLEGPA